MSITDTTDDNTKTKAFAGGNATDKDHQPTSMADTEEVKKASSKSTANAEEKEEATEEEEEETQVFPFDGKNYPTYKEMVDAKRGRNRKVLEESGLLEAKAVIDAEHAVEEGMYFNIMFIWTFS